MFRNEGILKSSQISGIRASSHFCAPGGEVEPLGIGCAETGGLLEDSRAVYEFQHKLNIS